MIKVVIDTNVLVSAVIKEQGAEAAVLNFVATGRLDLYVSRPILEEYKGVLARPKFASLDPPRVQRVLAILDAATVLVPAVKRAASPDESDNRFLECAEVAEADYLITGNARHFPTEWKGTQVVNARNLIAVLHASSQI
jgi:uncharacterized protein